MRNHGPSGGGGGTWQPAPVAVLPEQFYRLKNEVASLFPAQRLAFAMLELSMFDVQRSPAGPGAGPKECREAERWFSSSDHGWPFSFVSLCDALGINPNLIREGLRRWRNDSRGPGGRSRPPRRMRRFASGRPRKVGGRSALRGRE